MRRGDRDARTTEDVAIPKLYEQVHILDMSITEASRFQLRTAVGRIMDEEAADTLMELLPSVGWADVATKHDLTYMRADMHRELEIMRAELAREIQNLRAELAREIQNLRLEFRADISEALLRQTRWFVAMLITVNTATVGLVFAAMKLL
ncbi:MAG: hypothetical protein RJA15_145 [Actinomycetota bacterium]